MRHLLVGRSVATLSSILIAFPLLISCLGSDKIAPPPPTVEPVRSPTSLASQRVSGFAEYGSRVMIEREPALDGAAIETRADSFSAAWSIEVPLAAETENVFRLVAVDAAGNRSGPTEVMIVREAPIARAISLGLEPPVFHESVGALLARAKLQHPEPGVDLTGKEVVFDRSFTQPGGVPDIEQVIETTDRLGEALVLFDGLTTAGEGFVRVRAEDGTVEASSPFLVHGDYAGPVSISLQLEAVVGGETIGPAGNIEVPAGTEVSLRVTLRDQAGNPVDRAVVVTTDAPGAIVESDRISGISMAGSWVVSAMAPGTALVASARLDVVPGPPHDVSLLLAQRTIPLGLRLPYSVDVEDAWGNRVGDWSVSVTTEPGTADVDTGELMITFKEIGEYDVIAEADGIAGASDTRRVLVVENQAGDPPRVVTLLYPPNEAMIGTGARPVPARVSVVADSGISEIRLHIRGAGLSLDLWHYTPEAPTSGVFTLPVSLPTGTDGDRLTFTATAVDMNGRITVGSEVNLNRVSSPIINPGYAVRPLEQVSGETLLSGPRGMARFATDSILVVDANSRIVEVNLLTGAERDLGIELPGEGYDIEVLPNGQVLVSYDAGVARLNTDGSLISMGWLSGQEPRGMHLGEDGNLYVARRDDSRVYVFDPGVEADREWADRLHHIGCDGELGEAWGVLHSAIESTADSRVVYVSRHNDHRVLRCVDDGTGGHISDTRAFDRSDLSRPRFMASQGDRDLLVSSRDNGRILRARHTGSDWDRSIAVTDLTNPFGLLALGENHFVLSDEGTNMLWELFVEPSS